MTAFEGLPDRFLDKIAFEPNTGCWLWTAGRNADGYGWFKAEQGAVLAHRYAYERLIGPVPDGRQLDHLCRVRHCVNVFGHIEPVTCRENVLRGTGLAADAARRTHCINGHPFDEQNTIRRRSGRRDCRACGRARCRAYMRRKRTAA